MQQRRTLLTKGAVMGLLSALGWRKNGGEAVAAASVLPSASVAVQPVAQLIGANLISPLTQRGYPLAFNLPGFLDPGPRGVPPKKVWAPVDGTGGTTKRSHFVYILIRETCAAFTLPVSNYNRTTYDGFHFFLWNGIKMNGLKIVSSFEPRYATPAQVNDFWTSGYGYFGGESQPDLALVPSADGWSGLLASLDYIRQVPGKGMWMASADAPNAPKDEQPNEAAVLLMLANPGFATGRTPLVNWYAPAQVSIDDMKPEAKGNTKASMAYRAAIEQAAANAGIAPKQIGTWVRDAGRGTKDATARLVLLTRALHDLKIDIDDFDDVEQNVDMVSLLGDLGANTVSFSLLMASYAAHRRNHPVMYVSTQDAGSARAIVVLPPPNHTPPPERQEFRYATTFSQFNRPWWGKRLDGKKDI